MSRSSRGKILLILSFLLTLGAGVVVGVVVSVRTQGATAVPPASGVPATLPAPPGHSKITDQLKLTPQQQEQMNAIWQESMQGPGKLASDQWRVMSKQRDDAVLALYTSEQRAERDRIVKDYGVKLADLNKEREKLVQAAVDKTKLILTEEQRTKYEAMLKERADRDHDRDRWGRRGGPAGGRPGSQPSTRPGGPPSSPPPLPPYVPESRPPPGE